MQNIVQGVVVENIYILCVKYLCCFADICQLDALLWNLVKWKFLCSEHPDWGLPTSIPGFLIETTLGKPLVILAEFRSNCHKA